MSKVERPKARILVVDDEPEIVRAIRTNLELEGYEVLEAYNGPDALKIARSERPDLVVLDVLMPEMDGWQVLREIRGDKELKDTPVVLLTALSSDRDVDTGWELGAHRYLTKPFEPQRLIEVVRELLKE
ncbi:MAG TPA: response regulator [Armatimonadetes bacterium]|nr:response regulator [Armatimonadota bacterium]